MAWMEQGWPSYNGLLQDRWRVFPAIATEPVPVFVKILSQWSPIIQNGMSRTIPLVTPEWILQLGWNVSYCRVDVFGLYVF